MDRGLFTPGCRRAVERARPPSTGQSSSPPAQAAARSGRPRSESDAEFLARQAAAEVPADSADVRPLRRGPRDPRRLGRDPRPANNQVVRSIPNGDLRRMAQKYRATAAVPGLGRLDPNGARNLPILILSDTDGTSRRGRRQEEAGWQGSRSPASPRASTQRDHQTMLKVDQSRIDGLTAAQGARDAAISVVGQLRAKIARLSRSSTRCASRARSSPAAPRREHAGRRQRDRDQQRRGRPFKVSGRPARDHDEARRRGSASAPTFDSTARRWRPPA